MDIIIKKIVVVFLCITFLAGCARKNIVYIPKEEKISSYKELYFENETYEYNSSMKMLLVAGTDDNDLKGQTDFISLFLFDRENKQFNIINIPRELVIETNVYSSKETIVSTKRNYINLIFPENDGGNSGALKLSSSISSLLNNIPINNYIIVPLNFVYSLSELVTGMEYVFPNNSLTFVNTE